MNTTLRNWREQEDLTQDEAGKLVGKGWRDWGKWERGETKVPLKLVRKLSEITAIPPADIRPELDGLVQ